MKHMNNMDYMKREMEKQKELDKEYEEIFRKAKKKSIVIDFAELELKWKITIITLIIICLSRAVYLFLTV